MLNDAKLTERCLSVKLPEFFEVLVFFEIPVLLKKAKHFQNTTFSKYLSYIERNQDL
jgi:hypothetical protein